MQSKYNKYYPLIKKANEKFNYFLNEAKKIANRDEKHKVLSSLIEFAVYHNVGIWTSSYMENFYTDWAKTLHIENSQVEYKKNSFLHVLTTGYKTGGHTRVVERWIKNAPLEQNHSVVFINPNNDDMSVLEEYTKEKSGECFYFDNNLSLEEKALKLRELSLKYEYIVLHTHMEDVIPLLAFGTEEFTHPVLLYNHASLMFWLGKSISDLVLDLIKDDEITKIKRNIQNTFFLGVPSKEIVYSTHDKKELRKKLGLPIDKKIIVSAGSEHKFCIIDNDSFSDTLLKLIDENTYCYIIGIQKNNKYWKKIQKQSNGHIIPLGYIDFNDGFLDYLSSADLYVDSYPMTGGATMIDAISRGVPSISLKTVDVQLDYFASTSLNCETKEEFVTKAKKILNDSEYAKKITEELQNSLKKYQDKEVWNNRISDMIKVTPKNHEVKNLSDEKDITVIDDLTVLINVMTDKNFLNNKSILKKIIKQSYSDFVSFGINYHSKGIHNIFEVLSFRKAGKKTKVIKIFGLNVLVK